MAKAESAAAWALSRVGNPYLMGGTGQFCTVSYRKARAAQYPGSAAKIQKNCQRMNGTATSCKECRWYDESAGTGKRAYDCAQLTRWAMDSVGIQLVSGATSQWNKTKWAMKGEISALPREKMCLVFRRDEPGVMGHVGLYLGDGTAVHAKGHDYGVVRETVESYGRWTHFGIPVGLYEDLGDVSGEEAGEMLEDVLAVYQVTGGRLALRKEPRAADDTFIRWIPSGARIEGLRDPANGWVYVRCGGQSGYCMEKYLQDVEMAPDSGAEAGDASSAASGSASPQGDGITPHPSASPTPSPQGEGISIPRDMAEALHAALGEALGRQE